MNSRKNWTSMFKSKASTSGNQLHETTDSSAMRTPYPEGVSSTNYEQERERSSPKAKSRWNPKPEQIQILENIYKSGMVIPPREEIKRIRVKLEEFGHLEDVNVFYWFQNKKSRTKLKQRQLQAAQRSKSNTETESPSSCSSTSPSKPIKDLTNNLVNTILNNNGNQPNSSYAESVSSFAEHHSDLLVNEEMSNNQRSIVQAAAIWNKGGDVQSSINANPLITVFINDIPVELPAGPINFKVLFGDDALLFHSSGHSVLMDEWGFTLEGLEPGALYFLM